MSDLLECKAMVLHAQKWKTCSKCERTLAIADNFPRNRSRADGYGEACLECQNEMGRESYAKPDVRDRQVASVRRRKDRAQHELQLVVEELLDHPCTECGERRGPNSMVMRYEEGEAPRISIREMARQGYAEATIRATAAKGRVVCRSCMNSRSRRNTGHRP